MSLFRLEESKPVCLIYFRLLLKNRIKHRLTIIPSIVILNENLPVVVKLTKKLSSSLITAGFKVPTPIGNYVPDWAVVLENGRCVYFVAETKEL
jgi:hypothetical protein